MTSAQFSQVLLLSGFGVFTFFLLCFCIYQSVDLHRFNKKMRQRQAEIMASRRQFSEQIEEEIARQQARNSAAPISVAPQLVDPYNPGRRRIARPE